MGVVISISNMKIYPLEPRHVLQVQHPLVDTSEALLVTIMQLAFLPQHDLVSSRRDARLPAHLYLPRLVLKRVAEQLPIAAQQAQSGLLARAVAQQFKLQLFPLG